MSAVVTAKFSIYQFPTNVKQFVIIRILGIDNVYKIVYTKFIKQKMRRKEGKMIDKKTEKRFWAKVDKMGNGECWEWTAQRDRYGYGRFWIGSRRVQSPRFSWEIRNGAIPDGMFVCHSCDNRGCVNPDHLWIGTNQENMTDKMLKDRHGTAKLTNKEVLEIRDAYPGQTQKQLGEKYKVDHSIIGKIVRRQRWTHI